MRRSMALLLWGFFIFSARTGFAGQVAIANFSFETPAAPVGFSNPGNANGTIPGWQIDLEVGGGTVTCSVSSNVPPNSTGQQVLNMSLEVPSSIPAFGRIHATASNVLIIDSNTTYTLTVTMSGSSHGAGAGASLLAGSSAMFTADLPASPFQPMTDFSTSFSTSPSGDPLVGQPLSIQLHLQGNYFSQGTATFDNVRLAVEQAGPVLKINTANPGLTLLSWSTNYPGYDLESTAGLPGAIWDPVTNNVTTTTGQFQVTLAPSPVQNYFRLRQN